MKKGITEIIDTFSGKHWIESRLESLLRNSPTPQKYPDNEFHPHWAGNCPRYIQFIMNGVVVDGANNHRIQRIFDNGSDAHIRYQRYFKELGILKEAEKPMSKYIDGIFLIGTCDAIIEDPMKKDFLVELKTINTKNFNALTAPKLEHFLQWNLYSGGLDIPRGAILYEDKDNQTIKLFPTIHDTRFFYDMISMFKEIHKGNLEGRLVPISEDCKSRFCPVRRMCKEVVSLNGIGEQYGI